MRPDIVCAAHKIRISWVIKKRRRSYVEHVTCKGEKRTAYRILVGKAE